MNFEQFAVELITQHCQPQKRIYEYEPIFMELRRQYLLEEYALEIEQNVKPKASLFCKKKEVNAWIAEDTTESDSAAAGKSVSAEESEESCVR